MTNNGPRPRQWSPYVGWWAAGIVLLLVFASAAAVWFMFHPL